MRGSVITRNLLHIKQIQGSNQNFGAGRKREGNVKCRPFKLHFISQRLIMLLAKQGTEDMGMRRKESVRIMIDMSKAKG